MTGKRDRMKEGKEKRGGENGGWERKVKGKE